MQFTFTKSLMVVIVTVITASHANAIPVEEAAAQGSLVPAVFTVGKACVDARLGGICKNNAVETLPSACINFDSPFGNSISSIFVQQGFSCSFFIKRYCGGQDIVVANNHTVNDLSGTNFDNAINSFSCTGEYYYTEP